MSWLSGYTFRKKCTVIATAAGAQTNYQLKLKVGESSGAASEDVDCESHCEDFPNDIRFTKEDGETKHDYWVESVTGSTPNRLATVIIEIASVPASGSVDFYMYYGKSADAGESDGDGTFLAFDDASGYEQEIHHNTNVYSPAVTKLDNGNLLLIYYGRSALWQKLYESLDHGASWSLKSTPDASNHLHPDITSYGNNDVWICSNGSGNITSRKSSDGGSTWASEVNIVSDTDRDDSAILYINASLLLCAIQYKASPYEIEIYKSINGGTSWSFVVNAVTGSVKYEDIVLEIAPNDDIVLAYEKEWVEGGHAGIYCVKSSNNGTTWGSEITIYDDGSADNEGGAMLTDGSDMYYFFPTDEDKGSGSYKENNVKRMKSTDNGATWGNKTLILDSKFTTEPDIIKAGNGDILFFGCRQYPSASYIFQVEIDMSSPKLFGTKWTQDYGLVYSILDGTDKVLAVEGRIDQAKRAFVVNSLNVADCKIEYSGKTTGTAFDTRSVFRYTDVNNHYQVNHSPTNMNFYERVSGTYYLLDSDASAGVVDTWYDYIIQVLGTNIKTWVDANARNDKADSSFTIGKTGLSCTQTATKQPCLFKDYRVSKLVSPEPTWGTWGGELCEIISSDVGTGVDAASPVQASITQTEAGSGADAISASASSRLESEAGSGADAISASASSRLETEIGSGADAILELLSSRLETEIGSGADAILELLSSRLETDAGVGVDALISIFKAVAKFSSDTGVGTDAILEQLAALVQTEAGSGADAISASASSRLETEIGSGADAILELLSSRLETDAGVGVDAFSSLVATLVGLDLGLGVDVVSKLLAEITDSDSGSGVETSTRVIWMYILLKLLQKKGLNIELSQESSPD